MSAQIRLLERELGTQLFDRLPTGALLTGDGLRLHEEVEELLDAEARLRYAVAPHDDAAALTGQVTVGAGESTCASRLPAVIASLRRSHPGIDVHLCAAGTTAAVEGLRAGRMDIALLLEARVDCADLLSKPIAHEPLVYVASPEHPLAGRTVGWEEFVGERFFVLEEGCSYSDQLVRMLQSRSGPHPRLTRFGSIEATRACVAAGLGLSLLPSVTVERQLGNGELAVVGGPEIPPVPIQLVRHRRRWLAPTTRVVADALARQIHF